MKKATLIKQGKYWKLNSPKYSNPLSIYGNFKLTDDMVGEEVEFDNSGGSVKLIRYKGKDYTKQAESSRRESQYGRENRGGNNFKSHQKNSQYQKPKERTPARAPYNFVPLNREKVLATNAGSAPQHDQYNNLSGYIDISIEARSEIFIRGKLEKFFQVGENFAIPGSSLRGMIRNLTEIVAYGKMDFVDGDRRLFFRNIRDKDYRNTFVRQNDNREIEQISEAAWLRKDGKGFALEKVGKVFKVETQTIKKYRKANSSYRRKDKVFYEFEDIWFDPSGSNIERVYKSSKGFKLVYNEVKSIFNKKIDEKHVQGVLLTTGHIPRKHFQWIIPYPEKSAKTWRWSDDDEIMKKLIHVYQMDEGRISETNLLTAFEKTKSNKIPCFYLPDNNGDPIALGHTGMFRLPYQYDIKQAVQQENADILDFARSLFGYVDPKGKEEEARAGKVFFEDVQAITEQPDTDFAALKILSSPKPTSFQLYLEQPSGDHSFNTQENDLEHWGTKGNKIRGYKLYWHRKADWKNEENRKIITPEVIARGPSYHDLIQKVFKNKEKPTQYTIAEVLAEGTAFQGRIRFDNLTREELGALLFALDLPESCGHKIGLGKPLGLGSVRITPTLTIIDRTARYNSLFTADGNWEDGKAEEDHTPYKNAFAAYIGGKTDQPQIRSAADYWANDPRMQQLQHLLTLKSNWQSSDWIDRTRYMQIEYRENGREPNEYKGRSVLPKPQVVVARDTYTNQ